MISLGEWRERTLPHYPDDVRTRLEEMDDADLILWMAWQMNYPDWERADEMLEASGYDPATRAMVLADVKRRRAIPPPTRT